MVQCEMCGTETGSPNRIKIEGAELEVCNDCTDFGTEVRTDSGSASTSTKYSTSSSSSGSSSTSSTSRSPTSRGSTSTGSSTGSGGGRRRNMYDDIEELATDYDDRIRNARERAGLTQDELARQLNEKASLIQKLERGDTLPSDDIQRKLERNLDIDLTESTSTDETEWESDTSADGYTLGDVVKRKDNS